jgi:hypothetical protein
VLPQLLLLLHTAGMYFGRLACCAGICYLPFHLWQPCKQQYRLYHQPCIQDGQLLLSALAALMLLGFRPRFARQRTLNVVP